MTPVRPILMVLLGLAALASPSPYGRTQDPPLLSARPEMTGRLPQTIAGLKRTERAMYLYERIEREESRSDPHNEKLVSVKVARVFPAGTGLDRIPLTDEGKPKDPASYRAELDQLMNSLTWAAATGKEQTKAYDKIEKKLKEREELIDTTRNAFLFTFLGREMRQGQPLLKFHMDPNPAFKPTNRNASFLSKVKGTVWIDESASQLARIEGEVTDDISFGIFLGKIYKGSTFMQDRYPTPEGVWLPSYSQYDFDGRKLFSSVSIHQKTFYKDYRRVGPPLEAIPLVRVEIAQLDGQAQATQADPK